MTEEQRDQVCEILRCTAYRLMNITDDDHGSMIAPFTDTVIQIYGKRDGDQRGLATVRHIIVELWPEWWDEANNAELADLALEAVARIETGEWGSWVPFDDVVES